MNILSEIAENLELGDDERVFTLTQQALQQGITAQHVLNEGLLKGMEVVGQQFKKHEIFLPDVLMAAKAMQGAMELLKPLLIQDGIPTKGTIILGTVQGDLHDIGKNLVAIMLKGAGYDILDLGTDVPARKFVDTVKQYDSVVLGMSALLTTTMPVMKEVMDLIKQEQLNHRVKTIVGGAPVNQDYASLIGADAYAYDATHAVEQVQRLLF